MEMMKTKNEMPPSSFGGGDGISEEIDSEETSSKASSSTNLTGSGGGENGNKKPSSSPADMLAEQQTRLVFCSKMLVFTVLLIAALGCAGATFAFARRGERATFDAQMNDYVNEIIEVSQITAKSIIATVNGLSITTTSYALDKENTTWPYVTIPDYDFRGQTTLELSSASYLALSPLVQTEQREEWEQFAIANQGWIPPEYDWRTEEQKEFMPLISPAIYSYGLDPSVETPSQDGLYAPVWQIAPIIPPFVNLNVFALPEALLAYKEMAETGRPAFSMLASVTENVTSDRSTWPSSYLAVPVNDKLKGDDIEIVAMFQAVIPWHTFFENLLPAGSEHIVVVVSNSCDQAVTYDVHGPVVTYIGPGDKHNPKYDEFGTSAAFAALDGPFETTPDVHCFYSLDIYPDESAVKESQTVHPIIYSVVVLSIFLLTSAVFLMYDMFVQQEQKTVKSSAERSNAIVSSLFPATVRDRLLAGETEKSGGGGGNKNAVSIFSSLLEGSKDGTTQLSADDVLINGQGLLRTRPIADLFPHATVLFADISGFTAWSSVREPVQVFTLLEQIYSSFDAIAKKRAIFKVETIGDCYVAATGLPDPRKDHAECMARFSSECRSRMNAVVKRLEVLLGPGTGDLAMRFGLHSGPVTAGVLRGEKSRFQLFGDTVNTAARMESNGIKNKIHLSEATANCLIAAGKSDWITPRDIQISAKGKGTMQTYWLTMKRDRETTAAAGVPDAQTVSVSDGTASHSTDELRDELDTGLLLPSRQKIAESQQRLVDWNVSTLVLQLKKIVAMRDDSSSEKKPSIKMNLHREGAIVLDEFKEVIPLSNKNTSHYKQDPNTIQLPIPVVAQLRSYVSTIASMYRENDFHSFDHASHVSQSVTKLLARVVTPDSIDYDDLTYKQQEGNQLHKYTYGITSDPLIPFACAFSALIHDVDHPGVPNAALVKENTDIAQLYKNKSVAEQNSVDLAWELLMEPEYKDLRATIYSTQEELDRFRQLVVNSVMATDIVDKELGALRKKRWIKAFSDDANDSPVGDHDVEDHALEDQNRKATIVIEHIIQASDVSHMMQHWHVYIKWNERFFHECYKAYLEGRADKKPSDGWYEGELGFYDFYVIPLAKKLKECGCFGVASDEYLNYALANRSEWETKGKEVVAGYLAKYTADCESN